MTVRPAKTQISLGIRAVCSKSAPSAQWVAKDPSFLYADSEDSDQTGWIFTLSVMQITSVIIAKKARNRT